MGQLYLKNKLHLKIKKIEIKFFYIQTISSRDLFHCPNYIKNTIMIIIQIN